MRRFVVVSALLMMIGVVSPTFVEAGDLDGTRWSITVTPDDAAKERGEQTFSNEFVFTDDMLTSSIGLDQGFQPSNYKLSTVEKKTRFETGQVSAEGGRTVWSGEIVDDTMKGTLIWTKRAGGIYHYTFTGKKQT